jgi:hypothetical protein
VGPCVKKKEETIESYKLLKNSTLLISNLLHL